jgi:hypothetical protein
VGKEIRSSKMVSAQTTEQNRKPELQPTQHGFFLEGIPVVQGDMLELATPSGWARGRVYWNDNSRVVFGCDSSGFITLSPTAELRWPLVDDHAYQVVVDYAVVDGASGYGARITRLVETWIGSTAQIAGARALLHLRDEVRQLDGASARVVLCSLRVTCVEPPALAARAKSEYYNLASMALRGWLFQANDVGERATWRFTSRGVRELTAAADDD